METLEWIPGPILITCQVQDPPGAQQREGGFWVMWGTDLIREIKYQIWREISECRTICSGRGWNSSKDLNKTKPDVSHQRKKVIFERGDACLFSKSENELTFFIESFINIMKHQGKQIHIWVRYSTKKNQSKVIFILPVCQGLSGMLVFYRRWV